MSDFLFDAKVTFDSPRRWTLKNGKFQDVEIGVMPRIDPIVEVTAQVARSVAACMACGGAIPKGSVRLSFKVELPQPRQNSSGVTRTSERFNLHAGCVMEVFEGVQLRTSRTCFDCGAQPRFVQGHPFRCFTGSRFAYSPLCEKCAERRRWGVCDECVVYYPIHMVSEVVTEGEYYEGILCDHCALEEGVKTKLQLDREEREFEELRRKLAKGPA